MCCTELQIRTSYGRDGLEESDDVTGSDSDGGFPDVDVSRKKGFFCGVRKIDRHTRAQRQTDRQTHTHTHLVAFAVHKHAYGNEPIVLVSLVCMA